MQDRFIFRVWSKQDKQYLDDNFFLTPSGELGCHIKECSLWRLLKNNDLHVIEQSTGLKDKTGKLIYEGDIVKCDIDFVPDGRVGLIRSVIFKDGAFQLFSEDGGFYFIMGFHNIKVIGNIHELEIEK